MDPKSLRTIVKTDLKLFPLKLKKYQQLTVLQKRKRAERTQLVNLMKSGTLTGKIFSDKTMFVVEAQFNPQNDRVLARHSEDIPEKASIRHGLGCSVKNLEIPSDFCERGCQNEHKCLH